jgi:hypothetical protein
MLSTVGTEGYNPHFNKVFSILYESQTGQLLFPFPKKKFQQDDTLVQYFIISCKSLYMFRVKQSPIIRSWIKLFLQHPVLINRMWPAVVVVRLIHDDGQPHSLYQHQML